MGVHIRIVIVVLDNREADSLQVKYVGGRGDVGKSFDLGLSENEP